MSKPSPRFLRLITLAVIVIPLLVVSGCGDQASDDAAIGNIGVDFIPLRFEDWEAKLASYPPDIVVVDMWATWCTSCLERFPHMIDMWRKYRGKGVRFVSLNLDDHDDVQALNDARLLLAKFGAEFENYYLDENLMLAFERLDLIGIPAVMIYDQGGREAARLTGDNPNSQFTEADVEAALEDLVDET